jgi:hypothetical protein
MSVDHGGRSGWSALKPLLNVKLLNVMLPERPLWHVSFVASHHAPGLSSSHWGKYPTWALGEVR